MSNTRLAYSLPVAFLVTAVSITAACADDPAPTPPSHDPVAMPIDPAGHYAVTSSLSLAAAPAVATDVLAELTAATDGPDDPSRYLIDLMIERMPDSAWKVSATALAPYLAAYLSTHIAEVAPSFAPGVRALAAGLSRIAQRFGTREALDITNDGELTGDASRGEPASEARGTASRGELTAASRGELTGDASRGELTAASRGELTGGASGGGASRDATLSLSLRRTVIGLRFDVGGREPAEVPLAPLGLPDITATAHAALAGDRLVIEHHALGLPYTKVLRLGLDLAVIPSVVPTAHDLASAFVALVDCERLGSVVADWLGIGSAEFYASACTVGLTALAAKIYGELDAIDAASLPLALDGVAEVLDVSHDGPVDTIEHGLWTGDFADVAVTGSFDGMRQ